MQVGIHPSKCVITKLKLDKDRKAILERKARSAPATRCPPGDRPSSPLPAAACLLTSPPPSVAQNKETKSAAAKGKYSEKDAAMADVD